MIKESLATMLLAGGLVVGGQMPDYTQGIVGIKPLDATTMIMHSHDGDACKYNTIFICSEVENPWAVYDITRDTLYLDNDRNGTIDLILETPRIDPKTLMPICK